MEDRVTRLFTFGHPSLSCKLRQNHAEANGVMAEAGDVVVAGSNAMPASGGKVLPAAAEDHAVRAVRRIPKNPAVLSRSATNTT
jgi:hypothetical protein